MNRIDTNNERDSAVNEIDKGEKTLGPASDGFHPTAQHSLPMEDVPDAHSLTDSRNGGHTRPLKRQQQ